MFLYRDFADQESIDAEYNPSARVADAAERMAAWQRRSAAATAGLEARLGVRYGPTLAEHVDVFPAGDGAPVHIFVHGGYWRRFAARDFAWVAEPLVARGITAVIVNYALCPAVSMSEIVRQTRAAVAWTHAGIRAFGGDPARLTISGHSAGGHLVGMVLATDWPAEYGLPADLLKGAIAVSGLFDLRPFPFSYLQPALQLTTAEVLALSPVDLEPLVPVPLTVAVGGTESAEFRRQSRALVDRWADRCTACRYEEVPGADHFTVLDALFDPAGAPFGRLVDWSFAG